MIAGSAIAIVIITIVIILLGVPIFKMLSNWKKRSLNIYENPYDYAVSPLPPCNTFRRIDSEIYDTISEDFCKDVSLQQADALSQTESPNGTASLDVASDSRDAKLNSMEFNEDHTGEQHNADYNYISSRESPTFTDGGTVRAAATVCTQVSVDLHFYQSISDPDGTCGQHLISDPSTIMMTNEMESSPENDIGIRMLENESYQPSLVSSITLDQNPAYETNVAIAPEIETEENIAYQHNLNVTESINDSVEQPS